MLGLLGLVFILEVRSLLILVVIIGQTNMYYV